MSNELKFEELDAETQAEYRKQLEEEATQLGVTFRASIGTENLAKRVAAARKGETLPDEEDDVDLTSEGLTKTDKPKREVNLIPQSEMKLSKEVELQKKKEYLNTKVRVQVTCNDPSKQSWQGELFEVSNRLVGEKREFVPFNVPWHVNRFILNMLKEKTFTHHYTVKIDGKEINRHKLAKAFNITELPPLTEQEHEAILKRQLANRVEDTQY